MNEVAKTLIEIDHEPITSFELLTDEEVLRQFIKNNEYWLITRFKQSLLSKFYNHLFRLLTVDCLIKIKEQTHTVGIVETYTEQNGKFISQKVEKMPYSYKLEWDYEREKEISPDYGFKTPQKHNLLIKINNSFPLKGYLSELGENFDYNQQLSAIKELVKDTYSMFVSEIQKTNKIPRIEFLVNRLIKEMNLELTHWSDVSKFENIVELRIDGVDFSAKIEKQFFSHNLPELWGAK